MDDWSEERNEYTKELSNDAKERLDWVPDRTIPDRMIQLIDSEDLLYEAQNDARFICFLRDGGGSYLSNIGRYDALLEDASFAPARGGVDAMIFIFRCQKT